ncbi:CBS domain-containing protein [Streptomyces wuyuanensis]|uniref:CBS domain-containing protein n=1 Tax=Streptomyces wuyuanensis TaxID=1196353 RepID=UPI003D74C5A3
MTPIHAQARPTGTTSASVAVAGAADEAAPQVWGEMTVEVALSVMAGARVGHLLLCDDDGRCTTLITSAQLATVRGSAAYTDRVRLGDVLRDHGAFSPAVAPSAEQAHRTALFAAPHTPGEPGASAVPPH